MLDFRIIITIAVISTAPYLTSHGVDLALDMIDNNMHIKRSKIADDIVMILYSSNKTQPHKDTQSPTHTHTHTHTHTPVSYTHLTLPTRR